MNCKGKVILKWLLSNVVNSSAWHVNVVQFRAILLQICFINGKFVILIISHATVSKIQEIKYP